MNRTICAIACIMLSAAAQSAYKNVATEYYADHSGGGGGGGTWGTITGNIADQTDLALELGNKLDKGDTTDYKRTYYYVDVMAQPSSSSFWAEGGTGNYLFDMTNKVYYHYYPGKVFSITDINSVTSMIRGVGGSVDDKILFDRTKPSPIYVAGKGLRGYITYNRYDQEIGSKIEDASGNVIKANRDVTAAIDNFVGGGDTLSPSRAVENKWISGAKSVWWTGAAWRCDGYESGSTVAALEGSGLNATKLGVIQPTLAQVNLVRTSATRSEGKVVCSLDVNRQMIFDLCHPVNSIWIQYTADDNPNNLFGADKGLSSTWTDITSTYNGRYFKADSANPVSTSQGESLPKPFIVNSGDHYHDMYSTWTPTVGTSGYGTFAGSGASASAGRTYGAGLHTHTVADYGPYRDDAAVKPLTSTVKVWKRTN